MKRILLVEDQEIAVGLFKRLLVDASRNRMDEVDVVHCDTVAEIPARLSDGPTDVIVLDLTLKPSSDDPASGSPEMTLEAIARHHTEWPPIVVLTGNPDIRMRERCILAGADDYVLKTVAMAPMVLAERCFNAYLRAQRTPAHGT